MMTGCGTTAMYFYPRPLRGGRPTARTLWASSLIFLSTPSARRATDYLQLPDFIQHISIHALCEEGDITPTGKTVYVELFLSTPSARRATAF